MLVLTRKSHESVVIGGSPCLQPAVTVTVIEIRAGRVKLGFEGDHNISVQRSEVWQRLRADELSNGHTEDFNGLKVR